MKGRYLLSVLLIFVITGVGAVSAKDWGPFHSANASAQAGPGICYSYVSDNTIFGVQSGDTTTYNQDIYLDAPGWADDAEAGIYWWTGTQKIDEAHFLTGGHFEGDQETTRDIEPEESYEVSGYAAAHDWGLLVCFDSDAGYLNTHD